MIKGIKGICSKDNEVINEEPILTRVMGEKKII